MAARVLVRGFAIWLFILILASLNGAVRDLIVAPRIGDTVARAISTVILCALVMLVACRSIGWIAPRGPREPLAVGLFWLVLTLAFEFGLGLALGRPWDAMLADYDLSRGGLLSIGIVVLALSPWIAARIRQSS